MSTAVLNGFNFQEIQQARKGAVSSCRYLLLAQRAESIANRVSKHWDEFLPEEREKLKELAHDLVEPSKDLNSIPAWISAILRLLILRARGQSEAFYALCDALDRLADNIFDAIEREDPAYYSVIADTLEEAISSPDAGQKLEPEEIRGWLGKLSDRAVEEV